MGTSAVLNVAEAELEVRSRTSGPSIPEAMRMAQGLLRDLQATCMGGDRVQAVIEALDGAIDEARALKLRQ